MTDQEILRLVEAGRFFVLSGTNTYTATSAATLPPVQSYSLRKSFYFKTTNGSTGASTINIDSVSAVSLVKLGGVPIASGDFSANGIIEAVYDGTNFQVISGITQSFASLTGKPTTLSGYGITDNITIQGNTFNGASQLVQLTAAGKYPALDGSLITGLASSPVSSVFGRTGAVVAVAGDYGPTLGGTGLTSYTTGDILYASATNVLSKLSVGTNGYVLTLVSGVPAWAAGGGGGSGIYAGTGTAFSSYATGDMIYASATNVLSKLAAGTNGYYLSLASGVPTWAAVSASAAGLNTQVQFNSSGAFGASSTFTYSPSVTATANNQPLIAMNLSPVFNVGAYTGCQNISLYSTGAIYFNVTGSPCIYLGTGGIIQGAASSSGSFNLKASGDGTGSINLQATTIAINNALTVGTSITATGSVTCGPSIESDYLSILGNSSTFKNKYGLQIAWNRASGYYDSWIVASSSSPGGNLQKAGEINFGFWSGSGGALTTYGGWRMTGSFLIGTTTEDLSALLNVASVSKGILLPRMSTSQKGAISAPATGLIVYDTTLNKLCLYTGSAWETITSS